MSRRTLFFRGSPFDHILGGTHQLLQPDDTAQLLWSFELEEGALWGISRSGHGGRHRLRVAPEPNCCGAPRRERAKVAKAFWHGLLQNVDRDSDVSLFVLNPISCWVRVRSATAPSRISLDFFGLRVWHGSCFR